MKDLYSLKKSELISIVNYLSGAYVCRLSSTMLDYDPDAFYERCDSVIEEAIESVVYERKVS